MIQLQRFEAAHQNNNRYEMLGSIPCIFPGSEVLVRVLINLYDFIKFLRKDNWYPISPPSTVTDTLKLLRQSIIETEKNRE